jgi:hypothetical protein
VTWLRSRSLAWLVLAVALCACRRVPSAERPTPRDAGPALGTPQDAQAPAVEGPILVVNDQAGERDLIWSGLRVSVIHGTIQVGAEPVPPILWVTPLAGGWLFLTQDGSLVRSDSFAGAIRRAGTVAPPYRPLRACRGRLAVVDDGGTLWLSDGTEPPARAALPEPGRALTAVFLDARRGIVVLEGGQLARTGDGGAHWSRVHLGGEAGWDVERVGDEARVETTAGPRAIDDSGALRPVTGELPPPLASPPDDQIAELRRAASRQRVAAGAAEGAPAPPARTPEDTERPAPPMTLTSEAYLCTPYRAPTPLRSPGTPPAVPGARSVSLVGPGARAALQIRRSRGRWLARAAWEGVDPRGSFSGASSESPLAMARSGDAADPESAAWFLEGAWRSGTLFRRCADEQACTLLHAPEGGPLAMLAPLPEIAQSSAPYSILPVGRAGALLLFRDRRILVSRLPNRERLDRAVVRERLLGVDTVLIPGPTGAVRTRAFVRLDADAPAALARRGGVWGYAAVEGDDARALRFHPLFPAPAAPAELRLPSPAPAALCGAARAPATELVGVRFPEVLRAAAPLIVDPDARAVLELSQDQICLRSLDSPSSIEPGGDHGLHVAAGAGGLTGVVDDGGQRQSIRCQPSAGVTD